ncbi:MAG: response regulator transcription factor [Armatimonadetes bacterium]|nr:response regulator transcription factor [Armatimonadota bacterium]
MAENRARILFVEDDPAVLASVCRRLKFEGYLVVTAASGPEALERFTEDPPDAVLLDVMLPGMDGLQVAERIRAAGSTPILMLTARSSVPDRVAGLECGADDYLVKPFAIEELLARLCALLRRVRPRDDLSVLRFADLTLHPKTRDVLRGGAPILMSAREFAILEYLLRHPRQVLSRQQIFETVWGVDFMGESNVIDVNIMAVRNKLESGGLPRLIQTVRGVGYSLREA